MKQIKIYGIITLAKYHTKTKDVLNIFGKLILHQS